MSKQKLTDPADMIDEQIQNDSIEEQAQKVSLDALSLEDLKAIPQSRAAIPHPFEGYPQRKVKDGHGNMINATQLVVLNPKEEVFQDPSGDRVTARQPDGTTKTVTIKTAHNRIVVDYENGGKNLDIVFDHAIKLADGTVLERCAFVPSPSARAQIMFTFDARTGRISADNRYLLADSGQFSRLRSVFVNITNPRLKAERDAAFISNETDSAPVGMEG